MRPTQPVPLSLRSGPFRRVEAINAGVTAEQLRSSNYTRVFRDVYIAAETPLTLGMRCAALALVLPPDAAFCLDTAAELYGLPLPFTAQAIHIGVPNDAVVPRSRPGVRTHTGISECDVRTWRGLRLTTPERTWLDLCARLSFVDATILGDAALAKLATMTSLTSMVSRWLARPDLCYPDLKIAIEYEGDHHRTDRVQWRRDISRDRLYLDEGWELIKVTAEDVFRTPDHLVDLVRRTRAKRLHQQRDRARARAQYPLRPSCGTPAAPAA